MADRRQKYKYGVFGKTNTLKSRLKCAFTFFDPKDSVKIISLQMIKMAIVCKWKQFKKQGLHFADWLQYVYRHSSFILQIYLFSLLRMYGATKSNEGTTRR